MVFWQDFELAATSIFGVPPRLAEAEIGAEKFWKTLEKTPNFYSTLPLMPDAMELYSAVKHLNPIILTGCPQGGWAGPQKLAWAAENFPGVKMITCPAKDKREHMTGPGDILVDDQMKYAHLWRERDGYFIHHLNARQTICALQARYELPTLAELTAIVRNTVIRDLQDGDRPII